VISFTLWLVVQTQRLLLLVLRMVRLTSFSNFFIIAIVANNYRLTIFPIALQSKYYLFIKL